MLTFFLIQWLEICNKDVNIKFVSLSVGFGLAKYGVRISISSDILIWRVLFVGRSSFIVDEIIWEVDWGFERFSNETDCNVVDIFGEVNTVGVAYEAVNQYLDE